MKPNKIILALLIFLSLTFNAFAAQHSPTGNWSAGDTKYKVYNCGSRVCAILTWLSDDIRTSDNEIYLNKIVVVGSPAGPNAWTAMVAFEGKVYKGSIAMTSRNRITIRACTGALDLLCKSFDLVRI